MNGSRGAFKPAVVGVVLGVVAAGLITGLLVWKQVQPVRPPNLILITVDTLRADHLGAYGYRRATSPNLDALAKESLLYRRAFSQAPETNPSLSSLMTSHYPHETQVLRNFHQLQPGAVTLAELLKNHGWRTGAVVSNYSLRRGSGFEQGFEEYDDRMDDLATPTWEGVERVAPKTTAAALDWLRRHRGDRFFLWVHFMDPHAPYTPPSPFNTLFANEQPDQVTHLPILSGLAGGTGTGGIPFYAQLGTRTDAHYYVSQYDGEIALFDHGLGELIREVRTLGLLERTLVILTADHGEGMGEHDYYFNHPEFVYSELIHVPLLIRLPGLSPASREVSEPVALVDVLPTILHALSLESPKVMKGQNLLNPQPRPIWAETYFAASKTAVIVNGLKLIVSEGRPSLYDLNQDFHETRDLLADGSLADLEAAKQMRKELEVIGQRDELSLGPPLKWDILPESQRKLKALGYVQ